MSGETGIQARPYHKILFAPLSESGVNDAALPCLRRTLLVSEKKKENWEGVKVHKSKRTSVALPKEETDKRLVLKELKVRKSKKKQEN